MPQTRPYSHPPSPLSASLPRLSCTRLALAFSLPTQDTMQFKLALLALLPALAAAAPIEPRQGGVSANCGGKTYTATQVNRAVNLALQDAASSSK